MKLRQAGLDGKDRQPHAKAAAAAFAAFTVMACSVAAAGKPPNAPGCDCSGAFQKATPAQVMKADSAAAAFRDSAGAVAVPMMNSKGHGMPWDTIYARVGELPDGRRAVISGSRRYNTADTFMLDSVEIAYGRIAGKKPAGFRLIPETYIYPFDYPSVKIRAVPAGKGGMSLGVRPLPYAVIKQRYMGRANEPRWIGYGCTGLICRPGPAQKVPDPASLPTIRFAELERMWKGIAGELGRGDAAQARSLLSRFRGHSRNTPTGYGAYSSHLEYGAYRFAHDREYPGGASVSAYASICGDSACTDNAENDEPDRHLLLSAGNGIAVQVDLALLASLFRKVAGKELGNASVMVDTASGGGACAILVPNTADNHMMKDVPAIRVTASAKGVKTEYLMVRE
ncbi:MAG: hypothetical protein PHV13_02560 [Candidatus ainarchaeum sp.]|nr:hypothetical protein [Candidatus ainarchaeum sp.]